MSSKNVSRRSLVPSLTAGAVGALAVSAPAANAAAARGRSTLIAGPCGVWPGHNLSLQFFFPRGQRPGFSAQCRLTLRSLDGDVLVTHDFELQPGTGIEAELAVDADGSVRFNGKVVQAPGLSLVLSRVILELAIAIARTVTGTAAAAAGGVAKVQATATSFVPGKAPGEQNVDYILPFIEQD
jgi:hypothetical protein